jgi:hypothetical protein
MQGLIPPLPMAMNNKLIIANGLQKKNKKRMNLEVRNLTDYKLT